MSARAFPPEADSNQARASDPAASAWVSANAGTGKTEVLVRRSLRLLLAGFRPESILCLTYTKTAAAEMQNRLLKGLGEWATTDDAKLREMLTALMRRAPDAKELRIARRLFARALEAKGGLKIHTIHGFCERLLQRFPLESQVTPHFSVLDDREQALLRRAAFDATMARAAEDTDGMLGKALAKIVGLTSGDYIREVINAVLGKRAELARMVAYHDSPEDWAEAEALALKRLFGVAEHAEDALLEQLADVLSNAEIDTALAAFAEFGSGARDSDAETALRTARASAGESRVAALAPAFLTQDGKPRAQVCSKAMERGAPYICALLDRAQADFADLTSKLAHLRLAEASAAVLALADAVQADYERRKQAEAVLDYDDLIVKTQNLLSRADAAAWVLYKIDGGIDHILVDEAQDTNPAQWSIIEALAAEFFAGAGASDKLRTLFAVGDEKQSIYSFQGANPARFGEVGRAFRQRAEAMGLVWHEVPLTLSFRSTEPILKAVDSVFGRAPAGEGLTWQAGAIIQHDAFRKGEAGLVELWEVEAEEKPDPTNAFEPWSEEPAGARSVDALCKRIAMVIKAWLDKGEPLPAKGRNVRAGDILILVRRRDPFTTPMIRELRRLGVAVAGADRMKLTDQLAVQDLIALADFLLMPEDDLALAVVLKSPLFGFDDDDLFTLAYGPRGSLWAALQSKANDDARFAEAASRLSAWLARVDFLPPYEFFSELLGADAQRLRKAMLTRLGPEAAEAIDEFLDTALAYDREAAPSLQGFVNQLRAGDVEIKRDMEQERDEVRIMTVHGAKGLQAQIVFLPDTCMRPRLQGVRLYPMARGGEPPDEVCHLIWPPAGHSKLSGIEDCKQLVERAEREEYHRLLYVAMTRAEDRLYVCGWEGLQKRETGAVWYDLVKDGLEGHLSAQVGSDGKPFRRMEMQQTEPVQASAAKAEQAKPAPLPAWALAAAPRERSRPKLAPSRLNLGVEAEPHALPDQPPLGPLALSENGRYARGRLVHALLQHLPEVQPEDQERAARAFVVARGIGLTQDLQEEIVAEALAIVRDPAFAPLFQPGSLAEVPVVARIGGYDLEGQIDRLARIDGGLLILDYKTNRPPPRTLDEVADAYIVQLAAYRAALRGLYGDLPLRAALLWTDGPRLMEIPSTSLDAAEQRLVRRATEP
ncbi:MAG: double-strand break repair helicase AddA [Methyloceanibacter sp.]